MNGKELEKVYCLMLEAGLVESKMDFSTRYMGKAQSYLTSMCARNRSVPYAVVSNLIERLKRDQEIVLNELEVLEQSHQKCRARLRWMEDIIADLEGRTSDVVKLNAVNPMFTRPSFIRTILTLLRCGSI